MAIRENKVKRKHRPGEYTCRCSAYRFPHRFGGGRCHGQQIVSGYWLTYFGSGDCSECNSRDENTCQVYDGVEKENECPVFQEFVDYEEIRLLGPYWKQSCRK